MKTELLGLAAKGKIAEALSKLEAHTKLHHLGNIHNEAVGLLARLNQLAQLQTDGTQDFDEITQEQNAINKALIALIQGLPDEAPGDQPAKKPKGITEHRFKNQVLYILLAAKLLILGFVFTLWESGAFTNEQFISVIGIIAPVFATYLTLILKDSAQNRHIDAPVDDRIVKRSFQMTAYWLLGIYFAAIMLVVNLRGQGVLSEFSQMTGLLAGVESGLGVYVGQIVFALFKKEK